MLNLFNNFIFLKLESTLNGSSKDEENQNTEKKVSGLDCKLTKLSVMNDDNKLIEKAKAIGIQEESLD